MWCATIDTDGPNEGIDWQDQIVHIVRGNSYRADTSQLLTKTFTENRIFKSIFQAPTADRPRCTLARGVRPLSGHTLHQDALPVATPARRWERITSGGTRGVVLSLHLLCPYSSPEQVVALGGLLCDRGQILGQQVSLRYQRLGGSFHLAEVVLLRNIALFNGGTRVT